MRRTKARESYIVRFFDYLTQLVYHVLEVGFLGRLFSSYKKSNELFVTSRTVTLVNRLTKGGGRLYCALRRSIALAIDQSFLRRGTHRLLQALLRCSLRTIGLFFVTAGAYSAVMYWLFSMVWRTDAVDAMSLYAGICALFLGILLLFFDVSLGYALHKGVVLHKMLVVLFGMSEENFKDIEREGSQGYVLAIPAGMVAGALAALVSPHYVLLAALLLFFVLLVLSIPESGVLWLIAFVPFAGFVPNGERWLLFAAAIPMFGYFGKLLRGNRVFHMDVQDFVVFLMLLFCLFSGVSVAGADAWRPTLIQAFLITVYFLVVNTIATPQWIMRCRITLILSATVASIVGIVQFIVAAVLHTGASAPTLGALGGAVRAGFIDRTTFAYFLVLVFPFALCAFVSGKKQYRLPAGLACVSLTAAAVLTWVQSAWIALALMLVVFFLIHERRVFPFVLLGGALTPVAYFLLPSDRRNALLAQLRVDSGVALEKSSSAGALAMRVFFENGEGIFSRFNGLLRLVFGLGCGGFEQFCVLYTALSPTQAEQTFNFWLYRLLEGGVVGVLLPIALFFLILQNCFSLLHGRPGQKKPAWPTAGIAMTIGVLVMSFFRYAWYDPAALISFFAALALIGADARYLRKMGDTHVEQGENDSFAAEIDYYAKNN